MAPIHSADLQLGENTTRLCYALVSVSRSESRLPFFFFFFYMDGLCFFSLLLSSFLHSPFLTILKRSAIFTFRKHTLLRWRLDTDASFLHLFILSVPSFHFFVAAKRAYF